ncbi:MAG: type II toxin-antitoxin system RelE/ParE family toxin [Gemmatimonadetes bacterium]|nr:type II toxin-antitoxin system RelE/ParE family toxin [Gemmatimonadota bacterium]
MRIRFRTEAAADVALASEWYDAQRPGLGGAFVDALERVIDLISDLPEAFPEVAVGLRRALLGRFPYALYYRLDGEVAEVIACLHTRQSPTRLRSRG